MVGCGSDDCDADNVLEAIADNVDETAELNELVGDGLGEDEGKERSLQDFHLAREINKLDTQHDTKDM